MTKAHAQATRAWWVVDATDKPLGRLASEVARVLRGKHKPEYTPHEDTGDFVVVVNAGKIALTGAKLDKKFYYRHSGIPGGFRAESYRHLLERDPTLPFAGCSRRASSAATC
jgi:large subunit ribosomal protein L13